MTPNPGNAATSAVPDHVFDLWLRGDLRRRFAAIAAEPVPAALLRLIEDPPADPSPPGVGPPGRRTGLPRRHHGFERRVRERVYFLWLAEGRPSGRAAEHWCRARAIEAAQEDGGGAGQEAERIGHA